MNIGNRIKARRKELGLSADDVATKLGKNRATVYRYESNAIENLPTSILEPLAKILETTPAALMGWEKMNHKKRSVKIPVLGRVAAGIPIETVEDIEDYEEIPETMAASGEFFALRIQGKSMEPRILDGDVVIVRKQEDIESGEIGVVVVNGSDATVKKVMKEENGIMLVATNQTIYPPKFYDKKAIEDLPVYILGRVVELRAKL
jgi:repressor LexA